ncbi:MAG: DNA repair protein RadC [Erysipelotrichaceae bacterium]|nr:DNA repair protein RadC [Erysipelotrichaceae bacterium]
MTELLPREKALNYGISSLNNVELLSLILKSAYKDSTVFKLAEELIEKAGGFKNLMSLSYDELVSIKGIKKAKAMEILAILEVSRRLTEIDKVEDNQKLEPKDLVNYLRFKLGFSNQEEFFVIFLSGAAKIIKAETLFKGTSNQSLVGVDEIFRQALLLKSKAIIIAHNHPSDNVLPSEADFKITQRIKEASRLFEIQLLDHIIISKTKYYSFKSNNLI